MVWKALLNRIDQLPVAVDRTWLPALQATQEVCLCGGAKWVGLIRILIVLYALLGVALLSM